MEPLRVLVCHPNALFVRALAELLESEGVEIISVASVEELIASSYRADACLVDVRMDGALDAISKLAWRPLRVVAYIDGTAARQLTEVLEAGAAAWVSAEDGFERLVRVLCTDRGWGKNERAIAERHALRQIRMEREASLLTAREFDVLVGLVEGRATKEIARQLNVSAATVRTHVHNVMAKLGVHTRLQAVAVAIEADLVRLSDDHEEPEPRTAAGGGSWRRD